MELRGRQAVDPGAPGEGRRGGLRPDGGQYRARPTLPARGQVRPMAARPGSVELYLCPARRAVELRPVRRIGGLEMASPATEVDVDGVAVRLTSPDKVYFPELGAGGTKR